MNCRFKELVLWHGFPFKGCKLYRVFCGATCRSICIHVCVFVILYLYSLYIYNFTYSIHITHSMRYICVCCVHDLISWFYPLIFGLNTSQFMKISSTLNQLKTWPLRTSGRPPIALGESPRINQPILGEEFSCLRSLHLWGCGECPAQSGLGTSHRLGCLRVIKSKGQSHQGWNGDMGLHGCSGW